MKERSLYEGRRRKGFTLVEILVAMAIIALLVALVAGVASLSRRQAGEARAMSHLRQIHIATALYVEDKAGYPLDGLDPVVQGGYLKDRSLLLLPEDPIPGGLGTRQRGCDRSGLDTTALEPTSFDTVFAWTPSVGFAFLDLVQDADPNYGWVATRVFSDVRPTSFGRCSDLVALQGRTLRLNRDGSVTGWKRIDRTASGNFAFCRPALFTSLDPRSVCKSP
jgi:prepilin-type N-terminal cleavage/methylation domain-containing protein